MVVLVEMDVEEWDEQVGYYRRVVKTVGGVLREQAWAQLDYLDRVAQAGLLKVGPKGYIHGWIFVGPQAVGSRVFHHEHGHGTVTRSGARTVGVRFDSGKEHAFEHGARGDHPRAGDSGGAHFADRVDRRRKENRPANQTAPQPKPRVAAATSERAIRTAYADAARRPGDWVPIADLRDRLPDMDREDVDEGLRSLAMRPDAQVIPWDNRNALSERDHAAALRLGGQDNHAVRVEPAARATEEGSGGRQSLGSHLDAAHAAIAEGRHSDAVNQLLAAEGSTNDPKPRREIAALRSSLAGRIMGKPVTSTKPSKPAKAGTDPAVLRTYLHSMIDADSREEAEAVADLLRGKDLDSALRATSPSMHGMSTSSRASDKRKALVHWAQSADARNSIAIGGQASGRPLSDAERAAFTVAQRERRRSEINLPNVGAPPTQSEKGPDAKAARMAAQVAAGQAAPTSLARINAYEKVTPDQYRALSDTDRANIARDVDALVAQYPGDGPYAVRARELRDRLGTSPSRPAGNPKPSGLAAQFPVTQAARDAGVNVPSAANPYVDTANARMRQGVTRADVAAQLRQEAQQQLDDARAENRDPDAPQVNQARQVKRTLEALARALES